MKRSSAARRAFPPISLATLGFTLLLNLVSGAAGCAANRAPVFEPTRTLGANVLVLEPDLRLGSSMTAPDESVLADQLMGELRRALSGAGLNVAPATESPRFDGLRSALIDLGVRARSQRLGRLRPGTRVELGEGAAAAREAGGSTVVLAVLGRSGAWYDEDGYAPRAPGEVMPLPDDKPDFYVPDARANSMQAGVDLELLAVSVTDSEVVLHRRVSYPAQTTAEIAEALPRLAREAARNLAP